MEELNVLELFSGIGGMHYSLRESLVPGRISSAIDINESCIQVYKHNHPETNVINGNINGLQAKNFQDINSIFMSPACQPFTRNNTSEKRDLDDHRTDPFLTICRLVKDDEFKKLKYVLMENVVGFEKSKMHEIFIDALTGFNYQEFIISPHQLNIPNTRHRYYCLARKTSEFKFKSDDILTHIPRYDVNSHDKMPVSQFLDESIIWNDFKLPLNILEKRFNILDISTCDSFNTNCFTKSYSKYIEGTGSVYYGGTRDELNEKIAEIERNNMDIKLIEALNLRFFSPQEIALLMSFPSDFNFPKTITNKTAYKLIGNSINVKVVSELIKILYLE